MNKRRKNKYINVIFTLVMALFLADNIVLTYHKISSVAVQECFQKLWDQTSRMRDELKENVDSDTKLLVTMSELLAGLPDMEGEEAQKILAFERTGKLVEQVELLLPEGRRPGTTVWLDYGKEAALGAHITGKFQDMENSGEWIAYNIVPVMQEGKTAALLCGKISLTKLEEKYCSVLEQNGSSFHLIEGKSSEFLVDTMHDTLGKADFPDRVKKDGDSIETVTENMTVGKSGEIAIYSDTVGEYLYGVYEPVGIQDWIVLLGIPESIAFENAFKIKIFFVGSAAVEALLLTIYFAVLLIRSRKMSDELEEQYNISQKLRQIQELLFHSVLKPEQMTKALEKLAELLTAKKIYLITDLRQSGPCIYHSTLPGEQESFSKQDFPALVQALETQGKISFSDVNMLNAAEEEKNRMRQRNIRNGMGIALRDSDNKYRGVLFAVNMTRERQEVELMEWLRFDFSMTLDNMEAFRRIKELGTRDQLTGLLNRNSYQKAMEFYEKTGEETLICVYIDVDGLHELNNQLGHMEGDRMLVTISRFLQEIFGEEAVYRIGGDEFLVFCCGIKKSEMNKKLKYLQHNVVNAGYHVSLGMADRQETPLVYEMVRRAESRMYEAKRRYYRDQKNGQKVREVNHQLEATLLEKRDLGAFCEVLSYKYVGVYIVNLSLDTIRAINIPEYFGEKLERSGGKFSDAIVFYMQELMAPAYHKKFQEMLDYEKLFRELSQGQTPEFTYCRLDGCSLLLKIHPTPEFDELQRECIWTFEILKQ